MRQNRRQLGFGLTEKNQASIDADETTGKRKGIDRWIADREEFEIEWRTRNGRHKAISELVEVAVDLGIAQILARETDLLHDRLAELALLRRRHVGARWVP